MKSLVSLGILFLGVLSAEPVTDKFLVKLPAQVSGITVEAEEKLPNECNTLPDCTALDACRKKLQETGSRFTLKVKSKLSMTTLLGDTYPGLKLDGNSTFCGIPFEVKKFRVGNMTGCMKKELVVKMIEKPGDSISIKDQDKVFGSAFGQVDTDLRIPVTTQVPSVSAYYVVPSTGCHLENSPNYLVVVAWEATFGADNKQAVIPFLHNLTEISLKMTPECDAKLEELLKKQSDPLFPRMLANEVAKLKSKKDCLARLSARLALSSVSPGLMSIRKNPTKLEDTVFGFRMVAKVPDEMKLIAFQLESDPKCTGNPIQYLSYTPYSNLTMNSTRLIRTSSRTRLELPSPIQLPSTSTKSQDDLYVFFGGCSAPQKASAELLLQVHDADPNSVRDDTVLIASKLTEDATADASIKPVMKSSCAEICKAPNSVSDCFNQADADNSKECKVDLTWKGKTKAGNVKRILDSNLGIGMAFSLALPAHENISNWVASGFNLTSSNASLVEAASPVACDFISSPRVVGKIQKVTGVNGQFEVKFQEPVPLNGGSVTCFVPCLGSLKDVGGVVVDWAVSGVFEALKDARKLIPAELELTDLSGDKCPMIKLEDHFLRQESLDNVMKDKLPGCKGSEVMRLVATRSHAPSTVEEHGLSSIVTVDPSSFPSGSESWSLMAFSVGNVTNEGKDCFVEGSELSVVIETSPDKFKPGAQFGVLGSKATAKAGFLTLDTPISLQKFTSKFHLALLGKQKSSCAATDQTVQVSIIISRKFEVSAPTDPHEKHTEPTDKGSSGVSVLHFALLASMFSVFCD